MRLTKIKPAGKIIGKVEYWECKNYEILISYGSDSAAIHITNKDGSNETTKIYDMTINDTEIGIRLSPSIDTELISVPLKDVMEYLGQVRTVIENSLGFKKAAEGKTKPSL